MDGIFCVVLVNIKTQECVGVEFCEDQQDLDFKKNMFLKDFGSDYIALTTPDLSN